jgi:hypothetical protein
MKYDIDYYYNLLRIQGKTGEQIAKIRWNFVSGCAPKNVLDYGCGIGFFGAYAPKGVKIESFDIMPVIQTAIIRHEYDLVTLWDVIEHFTDIDDLRDICVKANYVACTIPVKPADLPWKKYKHWKPGEHTTYYDPEMLELLMDGFGFKLVKSGTPECPPREYIHSFLFQNVNPYGKVPN